MCKVLLLIAALFLFSCRTTRYYIVRHAEKESASTMITDVPLSEAGRQRAEALRDLLMAKKIRGIYATNFQRTRATAQPLSQAIGVATNLYETKDSLFVRRVLAAGGNALIVGHSNTVDDLVNGFLGENRLSDLPETQYGDLFVIRKRGRHLSLHTGHFGK